jgi:hypothetical protein
VVLVVGTGEKLREFVSRVRGFRAAIALEDESIHVAGEVDGEKVSSILEVLSFITELMRKVRNTGVRFLVAEGSGSGIAYAKYGFGGQVIVLYRGMALGTVYYELKRLVEELSRG